MKYSQLKSRVRELEREVRNERDRSDYFRGHCERLQASFESRVRATLKHAADVVANSNAPIVLCTDCPNLRLPS